MSLKLTMIGAGSFFTDGITEGMCREPELFDGAHWTLMDIDAARLELALDRNREIIEKAGLNIAIEATTDRRKALEGCDYVITSCERERQKTWYTDIGIPTRFGIDNIFTGENGSPAGQAHAMRNISLFMRICADMRELCPDAWLLNYTNPMSFVCTYLNRYSGVKGLGFCHQVHGSMGVVVEMLDFEPGDLQVISAGINHMNWLLDIRRRGTGESFMEEFLARVKESKWWKKVYERVPEQQFTLEMLETFGLYPIGYDNHICEYVPFFYGPQEWEQYGYEPFLPRLRQQVENKERQKNATKEELKGDQTRARGELYNVPFPKDGDRPYYREAPTEVIHSFETNTPLYLDAMVIPNNGAVDNLPSEAVVDVPAVAVGGEMRSVHVGPLPIFAMELCRRQITIHELLTEAVAEGDRQKLVQSMALDPYVRSLKQAWQIVDAYLKEYKQDMPQFA